jgi:hypothetical protein
MAFLRVMVVDSLSLPPTPKLPPVIDSILDAQPELSTPAQQNRFVFISQFLEESFRNSLWYRYSTGYRYPDVSATVRKKSFPEPLYLK